ncbi:hypothetical protein F2Q70_00004153 [Brassica cretica]|uniref:Uncharacterized protein n=1 Tax=Brassica cretica TaxID=69181 RepID=A0A8S9IL29_BRACR|nr:hypothetical protein F2Q70_00004153 [Brassica cretica]
MFLAMNKARADLVSLVFIGCEIVDEDGPLGGFLLVQAGTLFKGRFPFILRQDKSLGLEAGGQTQTRGRGPRSGDMDLEAGGGNPEPGGRAQTRGQEPGCRRGEPGTWRQELGSRNLETSSRSMGHQTPLSIVLGCTCGRSERIRSLIGDISPGEWAIILDPMQRRGRHASMGICLVSSCTLDSDDLEDEMLPPWWGLVGVGQRFDREAGSVCIKGDASAHTPDAYAAPVAILGVGVKIGHDGINV